MGAPSVCLTKDTRVSLGEDSVDKRAANRTEGGEETVRTGQPDATGFTLNPASNKPSAKHIWRQTGEIGIWTEY